MLNEFCFLVQFLQTVCSKLIKDVVRRIYKNTKGLTAVSAVHALNVIFLAGVFHNFIDNVPFFTLAHPSISEFVKTSLL